MCTEQLVAVLQARLIVKVYYKSHEDFHSSGSECNNYGNGTNTKH